MIKQALILGCNLTRQLFVLISIVWTVINVHGQTNEIYINILTFDNTGKRLPNCNLVIFIRNDTIFENDTILKFKSDNNGSATIFTKVNSKAFLRGHCDGHYSASTDLTQLETLQSKDTIFTTLTFENIYQWKHFRPFSWALEFGSGILNNYSNEILNFDNFYKVEAGVRLYSKKICLGWRGSFLLSSDKNAGNIYDLNTGNSRFDNGQHTFFVGYILTNPDIIAIEPSIYFGKNIGRLFYDSLNYNSKNYNEPLFEPIRIYTMNSIGLGFNSYFDMNKLIPKVLNGYWLFLYSQASVQRVIQKKYDNQLLVNFSIGIALGPIFYKSYHF